MPTTKHPDDERAAQAIMLWLDGVPQREIAERIYNARGPAAASAAIRGFIMRHHPNPPVFGPTSPQAGQLTVWGDHRQPVAREALAAWQRATRPRQRNRGSRR